ncbi:N-acetylmuramoyl-L-alanine amidase [Nocardiopsis sp. CNT-189]
MLTGVGALGALVGAGLLGGVLREPAPVAATATGASSGAGTPRTRVARLAAEAGKAVRPDGPFDHVAFVPEGAGGERIQVRFLTADGPGPWQAVRPGGHGPDSGGSDGRVLPAPEGAVGYEVEAPGGSTVQTAAIDTREGERVQMRGEAEGILSTEGAAEELPPLRYVTRAGWGADESLRYGEDGSESWPREYSPVQVFTVHHAAMPVAEDPRETMRAIYRLHTVENGWGDIGYHLLIDPEGTVYEGRVAGGTVPVFQAPPIPGAAKSVTAAHAVGYNSGNIGICMLGDYTSEQPSRAARDRLVRVLRTLALLTGVDPGAKVKYVNPVTGTERTADAVAMHRDWGDTACPGDAFAARFGEIRKRVADPLGFT